MRIADEMIVAFVDGELDDDSRQCVEAAAAADREVAARIERYRTVRGKLTDAFAPLAEVPAPARLRRLVEGQGESEVVDFAAVRERKAALRASWSGVARWGAALAASLLLGLMIGRVAFAPGGLALPGGDGIVIAAGELAESLDRDLAGSSGTTRILLSFKARDGRICRVFEQGRRSVESGIACRRGERWQLLALAPASSAIPETDDRFHPAGARPLPPAIEQAVDDLIAGDPLGADAEKEARARGWR